MTHYGADGTPCGCGSKVGDRNVRVAVVPPRRPCEHHWQDYDGSGRIEVCGGCGKVRDVPLGPKAHAAAKTAREQVWDELVRLSRCIVVAEQRNKGPEHGPEDFADVEAQLHAALGAIAADSLLWSQVREGER